MDNSSDTADTADTGSTNLHHHLTTARLSPVIGETVLRMATILWAPGYSVSDDGRVWGPGSKGVGPGWLTPRLSTKGRYPRVNLCVDGVRYARSVHRLVALAFLGPPPPDKPLVLHRNGESTDPRLENLYYGDYKDNARDREHHNTTARGSAQGTSVLTEDDVREIRRLYAEGDQTHRGLAMRYGVGKATVRDILTGRCWSWVDDDSAAVA